MKSPAKSLSNRSPEKPVTGAESLPNPFVASPQKTDSPSRSPTRVAVRTEEEQQAAAKERERQEMLSHKDARRKSLGESVVKILCKNRV